MARLLNIITVGENQKWATPETLSGAAGANVGKLSVQIGLDGFAFVLKEFWPNIKHDLFERHQTASSLHLLSPGVTMTISPGLTSFNFSRAIFSIAFGSVRSA